jgi:hypothetical protein
MARSSRCRPNRRVRTPHRAPSRSRLPRSRETGAGPGGRGDRVVERGIGAAEQRLAERAAREQVGVLLPDDAVAPGQRVELLVDARRLAVGAQLGRLCVGEVAQAVALRVTGDVTQPDRVVARTEVVVGEQRLGQSPQPLEL